MGIVTGHKHLLRGGELLHNGSTFASQALDPETVKEKIMKANGDEATAWECLNTIRSGTN